MSSYLETWYVTGVPIVINLVLIIANVVKARGVLSTLDGVIRNENDLRLVRGVINLSMISAVVFLVILPLMLGTLAVLWFTGFIAFNAGILHMMAFSVPCGIGGVIGKALADTPVRSLTVTAEDPAVGEKFELSLIQWREARLMLPE